MAVSLRADDWNSKRSFSKGVDFIMQICCYRIGDRDFRSFEICPKFCDAYGIKAPCSSCDDAKTAEENGARRNFTPDEIYANACKVLKVS